MSKGRCAGCGESGSSCEIDRHIRRCAAWARLYQQSPQDALEPKAEYLRWETQDKADQRAQEVQRSISRVDAIRAAQAERFRRPPDILEEP